LYDEVYRNAKIKIFIEKNARMTIFTENRRYGGYAGKKRRHVRSELFYGTQASPWQCPNKFGIVLGLCYL